jgi:hypothetical protein
MGNVSLVKLDKKIGAILEEARRQHNLCSLLLADKNGLPVSHAGKIVHAGMSAIAPELIKVGAHAVRLGEYDSITCMALVLEGSHLMVVKDIEINGDAFVLVMDTPTVPKGIKKVITDLKDRIARVMLEN